MNRRFTKTYDVQIGELTFHKCAHLVTRSCPVEGYIGIREERERDEEGKEVSAASAIQLA